MPFILCGHTLLRLVVTWRHSRRESRELRRRYPGWQLRDADLLSVERRRVRHPGEGEGGQQGETKNIYIYIFSSFRLLVAGRQRCAERLEDAGVTRATPRRAEPPRLSATEQRLASQLLATTSMALADASALASVVTHRVTHLLSKWLGNKGRVYLQCVLIQIKVIGHVNGTTVTLTISVV